MDVEHRTYEHYGGYQQAVHGVVRVGQKGPCHGRPGGGGHRHRRPGLQALEEKHEERKWRRLHEAEILKVVPISGGAPILDIPWRGGLDFRWHPDGKTITFRRLGSTVTNLFSIPLTGGEPTQMTKFPSGRFSSYDWTADGRLVLVRTESTSDVVLISDWRRAR